ncbi:transporter [Bacteroidia bacterium]|nr:transporter [Bacteroidia bacterium]
MAKRITFATRFGTIVAVGGSVVGLGNIWRFPYLAGENGGSAFMLTYITISLLISIPIMLSEFIIGRSSRRNALRSFKKLSRGNRLWMSAGYMGILSAFLILAFYSVIGGWALKFLLSSIAGTFIGATPESIATGFDAFVAGGWQPLLFAFLFSAACAAVVAAGVVKGIERYNKILMPLMVLILVGLNVNAFFMSGWREGAEFLLRPDFGKITWRVGLEALGQSFFSMSIGMGAMITYGSYMKRSENMFRVAGTVAITDLSIAILSGMAIFPAVFTYGISPTSGPELVFLALPNIFAQLPGGYLVAVLFFMMLVAAAITSSVSLLEVIAAYMSEELRISRRKATILGAAGVFALSILCALSQIPGSGLRLLGSNIFDLFNSSTSNVLMPLGAMLIVVFAGWALGRDKFNRQLTSEGRYGTRLLRPAVRFMIRFVIPPFIALLFLAQIGFIK